MFILVLGMMVDIDFDGFFDADAGIYWNKNCYRFNPINQTIEVHYPISCHHQRLTQSLQSFAKKQGKTLPGEVMTSIKPKQVATSASPLPHVINMIAVHSTKGGVGKSTLATHLAYQLSQMGCRVGLLDADLYGPNIPRLTQTHGQHQKATTHYTPILSRDVSVMSMGYLVPSQTPLAWRGPMASAYFQQMLTQTQWPALDFLIMDCPPGTGDILLSMADKAPITAALLVTTPQTLAIDDCIKGIGLMNKCQIPLLGLVENLAYFSCHQCDTLHRPFDTQDLDDLLSRHGIQRLASLPMDQKLSSPHDFEHSHDVNDSNSASLLAQLALSISAQLAMRPNRRKTVIPPIVAQPADSSK